MYCIKEIVYFITKEQRMVETPYEPVYGPTYRLCYRELDEKLDFYKCVYECLDIVKSLKSKLFECDILEVPASYFNDKNTKEEWKFICSSFRGNVLKKRKNNFILKNETIFEIYE